MGLDRHRNGPGTVRDFEFLYRKQTASFGINNAAKDELHHRYALFNNAVAVHRERINEHVPHEYTKNRKIYKGKKVRKRKKG